MSQHFRCKWPSVRTSSSSSPSYSASSSSSFLFLHQNLSTADVDETSLTLEKFVSAWSSRGFLGERMRNMTVLDSEIPEAAAHSDEPDTEPTHRQQTDGEQRHRPARSPGRSRRRARCG